MSYKAKTLSGAQRRVRELERLVEKQSALLAEFDCERKMLAKLSARTPQFYNPLDVMAAEKVRDRILHSATTG